MNNKPHKKYTLSDGSITTSLEVSEKVGITIKNARTRLSQHSDPVKVWKKKQEKNKGDPESYKLRKIKERGMFDKFFVLAMKKI